MEKSKNKILLFAMLFVAIILSTQFVLGLQAVDLGKSGDFVILSKSGITITGTTAIVGNIGVSPISSTAMTGFGLMLDFTNKFSTSSLVTGKIYAANYAEPTPTILSITISDMETAYTNAAGRTLPDATELGAGDISGMTIAPGLYKWGTGVHIDNRGVTLSGNSNSVWIFQISQDLTVDSAAIITLTGGAQAKNVFWQVGGGTGVTLGTTSEFKGNILAIAGIVFNTGATLEGRALAQTAVTLDANAITMPINLPVISIITPLEGSFVSSNLTINVSVKNTDLSNINAVNFIIDGIVNHGYGNYPSGDFAIDWNTTIYTDGNHTINITAYNYPTNPATQSWVVTVDNTPPVISVPTDINATATSLSGAIVSYIVNATDVTSGISNIICSEPSGSAFPLGTTPVTCNATDNAGNTATSAFKINVTAAVSINYTISLNSTENNSINLNLGNINLDGTLFNLPTTNTFSNGMHNITFIHSVNLTFLRWNSTAGIIVSNNFTSSTTINITGDGTLNAIYYNSKFILPVPVSTNLTFSNVSSNITIGTNYQLNATVLDQFGYSMNETINYTSSNTSIATVNATTGLITAIDLGNFTITVTSGNLTNSINMTVTASPPIIIAETTPTPSSGGGGGGGSCSTQWTCSDWSVCSNGQQTRTCTYKTNFCTPTLAKPLQTQSCLTNLSLNTTDSTLSTSENESLFGNGGGITGAVIGGGSGPTRTAIIALIVLGLLGIVLVVRYFVMRK
ncbi:MAG: ice-binding family protein [Nanoarchaeota archaeon]